MSIPPSLFVVMIGDARTGDLSSDVKLFANLDKANEYALSMRQKYPTEKSYAVVVESEVIL